MSPFFVRLAAAPLAASLLFAGPAEAKPRSPVLTAQVPARPPSRPTAPGLFDLKNGAVAYIPASLPPGKRVPLLVLLHGARGKGGPMVVRFMEEADRRGIVLLAPSARGRTWDTLLNFNPYYGKFAPLNVIPPNNPPMSYDDDVARVDEAIALLLRYVPVDPDRVGLLGFSDGASYALALGLQNPQLFKSVIALAPGIAKPSWNKGPQRVLVAHGTRDRVLPFIHTQREIVPDLKRNGHDVTFRRFVGGHDITDDIAARALDFFLEGKAGEWPLSRRAPRPPASG
jgi:predicted esterase